MLVVAFTLCLLNMQTIMPGRTYKTVASACLAARSTFTNWEKGVSAPTALSTYHLPLTTYYLLLTPYCLLLTAYHLLLTTHYLQVSRASPSDSSSSGWGRAAGQPCGSVRTRCPQPSCSVTSRRATQPSTVRSSPASHDPTATRAPAASLPRRSMPPNILYNMCAIDVPTPQVCAAEVILCLQNLVCTGAGKASCA